jgi:inhibitor of cysteine peptidase
MILRSLTALAILTLVLAGCVPIPETAPSAMPDATTMPETMPDMVSGLAMVESVEVQVLEGTPASLLVIARGYLPDGCTSIDDTSWTQEGNTFNVTITTTRPADAMCTQALVPFEETVMISPPGGVDPGTYTVMVNDVKTEISF